MDLLQSRNKSDITGGSIGQLLATTRHEPRRKLSSISEKSIEMTNSGVQLTSAPSSASCPTTTRISKGVILLRITRFGLDGFGEISILFSQWTSLALSLSFFYSPMNQWKLFMGIDNIPL
ncbi:unnamed protein product [Onchocerca flexuosa]|uniref:Uncharacterized protein n=1 Tax=Onchocerca flexuosa TaxID=387005 RepID=A0A183HVC6_9BILA|nr:unnamed protein product [Onchocerca flexuosa]